MAADVIISALNQVIIVKCTIIKIPMEIIENRMFQNIYGSILKRRIRNMATHH